MKKYRFVAMMDILGFKELLEQKGLDIIHQLMKDLFNSTRTGTNRDYQAIINGVKYLHPAVRLNYFIFSDTILIWKDYQEVKNNNKNIQKKCELFREFNHGISRVLENALLRRIPLRGGIAFGKSIIKIDTNGNNHEIIGQPIVDAYLLGEAQDWVGVAFHSSCLPFIEKDCDPTVKYYKHIPYHKNRLKTINNGRETKYSLEWGGQQKVKEILKEIFGELKKAKKSKNIRNKYKRTIDFCNNHEVCI
jgi:hypothetical protein